MAKNASYGFDADGARRVVDAVRHVEGSGPPSRRPGEESRGRNIQAVRITGAAVGGYYPGVVTVHNGTTNTWEDLGTAPTVWVLELNDYALNSGTRYPAFQTGDITNGGTTRAGFIAQGGALTAASAGCGISVSDGVISVNAGDLAGCGLTAGDGCELNVAYIEKEVVVDFDETTCAADFETIAVVDTSGC